MALTRTAPIGNLFRSSIRASPPVLPRAASVSGSRRGYGSLSAFATRVNSGLMVSGTPMMRASAISSSSSSCSSLLNRRDYASQSGKSQADSIVEEITEHYFTTKDELEIATDSTDSATVYAPSDRESARDALNHLLAVYSLYTNSDISSPTLNQEHQEQAKPLRHGEDQGFDDPARLHVHGQGRVHGEGAHQQGQKVQGPDLGTEPTEKSAKSLDVETAFDPTKVPAEVREEVKKRVERSVKELQAAVEALEEKAKHE